MKIEKELKILALIPARSGSKSVIDKNIRLINGKPLIAYSIEHALHSKLINRIIVSTDSKYYANIARKHGAETPFIRPKSISQDNSTDLEVFLHALNWLEKKENYVPDICIHLRPTCPIRKISDIDESINILINNKDIDSVRSISNYKGKTPFKMWLKNKKNIISPLINTNIKESFNLPRQLLPRVFIQNASIDVVRTNVINKKNSMNGNTIFGYVIENFFDIDYEGDLFEVSKLIDFDTQVKNINRGKKFCFDIDGVIATLVEDNDYTNAKPMNQNINIVNKLYELGNIIILHTARGSETSIDWKNITIQQLNSWGVKYNQLIFGKPAADYYIDDKFIAIDCLPKFIL